MEAGPLTQIITKQEREYIISYDKIKLLLKFTVNSPLLKISIHNYENASNYYYENTFNKESLVKISKCLLMCESIDEISTIFINLIETKKYSLNKISENEFDLILKVQALIKEEEITLNLYKNYNITKDDIINNLIEVVQNLTKRVEELENWKKEKEGTNNNIITPKSNDIDIIKNSNIMQKKEELNLIEQRLKQGIFSNKKISFKLLYCGTKDGDDSKIFHSKCDDIQNQLVLVKTKEGLKFGGYTRLGFNRSESAIKDKDAFLFSFDLMKTYDAIEGKETIYCYSSSGPTFGKSSDISIENNFFSKKGMVQKKMNRFKTSKDYELNGGNECFEFKELEIFQVLFE